MRGAWVFVVGPSGAGKDSVLNAAQQLLRDQKNIVFTRRLVTRPAQSASEHDPITEEDFRRLEVSGGLSWHWQAHGFFYGVLADYATAIQAGHLVVVNGSRAHVNAHVHSLSNFQNIKVIEVTASKDKLATRLQQRGRDDADAITGRLARNAGLKPVKSDGVIVNDGLLASASQQLADYLLSTLQEIKQAPKQQLKS